MIDYARIVVKAGKGGDGAGSFRHIKGKRRGKADGGSGGNGGNVYSEATYDLNTLEPYRFVKDYLAKNGQRGEPNLRKGANGEDLVLKVPVGTLIKVTKVTEEPEDSFKKPMARLAPLEPLLLFDLVEDRQKILIARGGQGGRGNAYMRDEYKRRPLSGEKGEAGESTELILELKLIADVGLIGLPNSGKSTLLSALTAAKVAIAPYPFTTLEPNLGVLDVTGPVNSFPPASARSSRESKGNQIDNVELRAVGSLSRIATRPKRLILADIPGLIEGASRGKGLGDLFLRHIERTKILLHLIDVSSDTEKWADYQTIRNELKNYSKELNKKREILVLTKSDLVSQKAAQSAIALFKNKKKKVFLISAVKGEGLKELCKMLLKIKKS